MTLAANPSWATARTSHHRRSLFSILVFGVFLSGCMTTAAKKPGKDTKVSSTSPAEFTFEQSEVVIGSAKRQSVVTGFLLGGAIAELAVVNVDENDDRRLGIYAFGEGTWVPRLDATLRPKVLFVDVANIGGRDRLVTYKPGRLNWFDPESATERELVDLNKDGKQDILMHHPSTTESHRVTMLIAR